MWKANKRILRPHNSVVCGRGHHLTDDNVYMNGTHRQCKACKKIAKKAYLARKRASAS